jgi:hypothetical protein
MEQVWKSLNCLSFLTQFNTCTTAETLCPLKTSRVWNGLAFTLCKSIEPFDNKRTNVKTNVHTSSMFVCPQTLHTGAPETPDGFEMK